MKNDDIVLASKPYRVKRILKKTKARFFCDVKVDDILFFSLSLKKTIGASGGGIYAMVIEVEHDNHQERNKKFGLSQNILLNRLSKLELVQVE